ncbi:MAG: hypothetical protein KKH32_06560, partial [Bacteroidetes bacterium]|nr:hypothetical protein [Bacteroidota bacterium]
LSVGLFKALSNKGFSPIYLPPLIKTQMVLKNKFIVFRGALRLMEVVNFSFWAEHIRLRLW